MGIEVCDVRIVVVVTEGPFFLVDVIICSLDVSILLVVAVLVFMLVREDEK